MLFIKNKIKCKLFVFRFYNYYTLYIKIEDIVEVNNKNFLL